MDSVQTSGGSFPVVKFLVGLALFCGGAIYALVSVQLLDANTLQRLWPVILIFLGVIMEADAVRRGRFGCGIVLVSMGIWLVAGSYHLFGLSFRTALPLAVIVIGVAFVVESILEARAGRSKES